jgi:hypothetical protein
MADQDMTPILRSWTYEPGRINARRIDGADGRAKLQIRLDLGILQLEVDGRPDGQRPQGCDSLLDHLLERQGAYSSSADSMPGFVLAPEECRALREEAVQYYHRYVGLFALQDYARVVRDTQLSLQLFDLCRDYGSTDVDRTILEQFRPQVITMGARAAAELAIQQDQPKRALEVIDQALRELRSLFDEAGHGSSFEAANEVQLLRGMRDVLVPKLPASQRAELRERLQAALDAENYELAAILRDELRMME